MASRPDTEQQTEPELLPEAQYEPASCSDMEINPARFEEDMKNNQAPTKSTIRSCWAMTPAQRFQATYSSLTKPLKRKKEQKLIKAIPEQEHEEFMREVREVEAGRAAQEEASPEPFTREELETYLAMSNLNDSEDPDE